ncbi:MAG: tetratricopeptide repeat protein [Gemmatimonadetes bacterium]|nr:tetratricopeptide repeat protein [Gemmatimonadota bacterium]MBI2401271.1 tetratricopeptide repeat protein [Gemmatimonadota bacterium]MBI2614521.1 tetratricopeptide repeat protein [Gemmatimonadota bacterium]MBI3082705.1 tetratricopeptide repeat protein [Gemmatimonadota bacterium]
MRQNRRAVTATGAAAVIVVGGAWFVASAKARKEGFAARALRDAQAAVAAGNVPLATNDLSRLVASYRGTPAAEEGVILLGQLRLMRGEPDSAIGELTSFTQSGPRPRFQAAAYNLLGAALEQRGRLAEAGEAYQKAAAAWPYDYLRAQALVDAGRAFRAGGDTARAAAAYQQVLRDYRESPSALEARLRLGEIRRGEAPTS